MNRRRIARVLLVLSVLYWLVVVGSVLYNTFLLPSFSGHLDRGCHLTDTLLIYVECRGFYGAQLVSWVLNLPWIIFQLGYFVFGSESLVEYLVFVPLALLLWGPLVYPLL